MEIHRHEGGRVQRVVRKQKNEWRQGDKAGRQDKQSKSEDITDMVRPGFEVETARRTAEPGRTREAERNRGRVEMGDRNQILLPASRLVGSLAQIQWLCNLHPWSTRPGCAQRELRAEGTNGQESAPGPPLPPLLSFQDPALWSLQPQSSLRDQFLFLGRAAKKNISM